MARTIDDIYGKLEEIAKSLSSLNDTVEEVNGDNDENDGDGASNKKRDDKGAWLEKAFGMIDKAVSYAYKKTTDIEDQIYKSGRAMGYMGEGIKRLYDANVRNMQVVARTVGMTTKEYIEMQNALSNVTLKSQRLTESQSLLAARMTRVADPQTVYEMVGQMDKFGASLETSMYRLAKGQIDARKWGLSAKENSQLIAKNIHLAASYNFKTGTDGLVKMVTESQRLKFNLESVLNSSEKFFAIDSAIETSAKIQVLGGAYAMEFANGLAVATDANMDPEGYIERIKRTVASEGVYNSKTGEADFGQTARRKMMEFSKHIGIDYKELFNMATSQIVGAEIEKLIKHKNLTDDQIKWVQTQGRFVDGEWLVSIFNEKTKNFEDKKITELTARDIKLSQEMALTEEHQMKDIRTIKDVIVAWGKDKSFIEKNTGYNEEFAAYTAQGMADSGALDALHEGRDFFGKWGTFWKGVIGGVIGGSGLLGTYKYGKHLYKKRQAAKAAKASGSASSTTTSSKPTNTTSSKGTNENAKPQNNEKPRDKRNERRKNRKKNGNKGGKQNWQKIQKQTQQAKQARQVQQTVKNTAQTTAKSTKNLFDKGATALSRMKGRAGALGKVLKWGGRFALGGAAAYTTYKVGENLLLPNNSNGEEQLYEANNALENAEEQQNIQTGISPIITELKKQTELLEKMAEGTYGGLDLQQESVEDIYKQIYGEGYKTEHGTMEVEEKGPSVGELLDDFSGLLVNSYTVGNSVLYASKFAPKFVKEAGEKAATSVGKSIVSKGLTQAVESTAAKTIAKNTPKLIKGVVKGPGAGLVFDLANIVGTATGAWEEGGAVDKSLSIAGWTATGAGTGGAIGSVPGAIIGGILGFGIGVAEQLLSDSPEEKERKRQIEELSERIRTEAEAYNTQIKDERDRQDKAYAEYITQTRELQENYETTKLGVTDIRDPLLQYKAALATVKIHDHLITWYRAYMGLNSDGTKKKGELEVKKEEDVYGKFEYQGIAALDLVDVDEQVELGLQQAGLKEYSTGGIVDGVSKTGDRYLARVNGGEMILNEQQQAELFKLANGGLYTNNVNVAPVEDVKAKDVVGQKQYIREVKLTSESVTTTNDVQNINLNIGGTLKIEGQNQNGYIDINKLIDNPDFKQKIIQMVQEGLNSRNNGGRGPSLDSVYGRRGGVVGHGALQGGF